MESNNTYKGLAYGGIASCVAETATMPIDVIKTRLQLDGACGKYLYRGPADCATKLYKTEGPTALFKGLAPALLRQSTYGSLRYGLYGPIRNSLGVPSSSSSPAGSTTTSHTDIPLWKKIVAGGTSGALASAIANPMDLLKVRLQTDGQIVKLQSKQYTGMTHAFLSILREEGVMGLWKGVGPTVGRATILAAVELATYDEVKGRLLTTQYFEEGFVCTTVTSIISGFCCTVASSPLDVVKSRMMGQRPPVVLPPDGSGRSVVVEGGQLYRGMMDCLVKSIRNEGISSLYNGFWPNVGRVVPHVVIAFTVMENLKLHFG